MLDPKLDLIATQAPGFLSAAEGSMLHAAAAEAGRLGIIIEIGSYCGKSTVYLGSGANQAGTLVFAIDHHGGSVEHQPGEFFYNPELVDTHGDTDTLARFRHTIREARLEHRVIAIVGDASAVGRHWNQRVGMVFIDGGHSMHDAVSDYRLWSSHVALDGLLAIHDHYPTAKAGGQAPRAIIEAALQSGLWALDREVDSLKILRRLS